MERSRDEKAVVPRIDRASSSWDRLVTRTKGVRSWFGGPVGQPYRGTLEIDAASYRPSLSSRSRYITFALADDNATNPVAPWCRIFGKLFGSGSLYSFQGKLR